MDNFATNASGTKWWPNLEPMQVEFYLAGEITQVIGSIPWVRCASGNVFYKGAEGQRPVETFVKISVLAG